MKTSIDHLVIGARDLDTGIDAARKWLGVEIPFGGSHKKMGTHNALMKLGDDLFLEIIAVANKMTPPKRPRWFGLDDPHIRYRIACHPTLLSWVVNTDDLAGLLEQADCAMGKAELFTRANLHWLFSLPGDGRLIAGGMMPYAIEWLTSPHPAAAMPDLGCNLSGLVLHHNQPEWLYAALRSIGAEKLVTIQPVEHDKTPYMEALINTPGGQKIISNGHNS